MILAACGAAWIEGVSTNASHSASAALQEGDTEFLWDAVNAI